MKKLVFTNGCFDILHIGHIKLLEECRKLSSDGTVIVGLNSDDSVRRLKGSSRPINDQYSRKILLESVRFVDKVIVFDEDTPENLLSIIKPDVLVKGGDYSIEQIVGKQFANEVVIFSYLDGFSTTSILQKISQNSSDR